MNVKSARLYRELVLRAADEAWEGVMEGVGDRMPELVEDMGRVLGGRRCGVPDCEYCCWPRLAAEAGFCWLPCRFEVPSVISTLWQLERSSDLRLRCSPWLAPSPSDSILPSTSRSCMLVPALERLSFRPSYSTLLTLVAVVEKLPGSPLLSWCLVEVE